MLSSPTGRQSTHCRGPDIIGQLGPPRYPNRWSFLHPSSPSSPPDVRITASTEQPNYPGSDDRRATDAECCPDGPRPASTQKDTNKRPLSLGSAPYWFSLLSPDDGDRVASRREMPPPQLQGCPHSSDVLSGPPGRPEDPGQVLSAETALVRHASSSLVFRLYVAASPYPCSYPVQSSLPVPVVFTGQTFAALTGDKIFWTLFI